MKTGGTPSRTTTLPRPAGGRGTRAAGSVRTRSAALPCPYPAGSSAFEVWNWLAYRGARPTRATVERELAARPGAGEYARPPRPTRRREIAARLASRGPSLAAHVDAHWAAHGTGPTGPECAAALRWPGDPVDHQRALDALTDVEWVTLIQPGGVLRPGTLWTRLIATRPVHGDRYHGEQQRHVAVATSTVVATTSGSRLLQEFEVTPRAAYSLTSSG